MSIGRKPIHMEMQGRKSNRQRIWEAVRAEREAFKILSVAACAKTDYTVAYTYIQSLIKGAYVKVIAGEPHEELTLQLVNDIGAEAPAITRQGKPSQAGKGTEAMWRSMRILGELNADELAQQASIVTPTKPSTARSYLNWLKRASIIIEVSPGVPGRPARYRIAPGKYTGPRAPMIQKIGQVFDPNLGEVVFRQEVAE